MSSKGKMQNLSAAWLYPVILATGALQARGRQMNGAQGFNRRAQAKGQRPISLGAALVGACNCEPCKRSGRRRVPATAASQAKID
jgi:hypothetical protein